MNKLILFTLTFLLFAFAGRIEAQDGTVRGTVIDDETGEPVYGVTVLVERISSGTTTDFDGKFDLKLPEGSFDLRISYVSYAPVRIMDVEVVPREVTVLDHIRLTPSVVNMEEVVVTADVVRNSEEGLITIKRKSANLMDGISASGFKKTGDSDAGEALKRVTGISVEGGKYIYVRGLGDRYTKTLLNSVDIPSLDPDRNSLQVDIFPTNLIDNMIISKSAVSEMPADFTGGVVNIETKDFLEQPVLDVSFEMGYNPGDHFNNNFLTYDENTRNFPWFDSNKRKLPHLARNNNIPTPISGARAEDVHEFVKSFNPSLGPRTTTNMMDYSFGVSLGSQHDVGAGHKLGYIFSGTYKRSSTHYNDFQYGEYQTQPDAAKYELVYATTQNGAVSQGDVLLGGLAGLSLKTNSSKYKLTGMHLQNGQSKAAHFFIDNSVDAPGQSGYTADSYNLEYGERGVTNFLLNGVHYFNGNNLEVDWRVSPTFSSMVDPDVRRTTYTHSLTGGAPRFIAGAGGNPSRMWRSMDEVNIVGKFDITRHYNLFRETAKIKIGGSYVYKERDYEILKFDMQSFGAWPTLTGDPSEVLKEENIYPNGSIYYQSGNPAPNPNAYNSTVGNMSFYVSNETTVFSKLKLNLGLRAEQYVQRHTGRDALYAQGDPSGNNLDNKKVLDTFGFFPSVNATYFLSGSQNLRFSYSRTIARPSFKELSYAQILDPISDRIFNGGLYEIDGWNGNLRETSIHNFDLRWEKFFGGGQLFSTSLFYKAFDAPIELVRIQAQSTSSEFQPRNVGEGRVFGAEFELRQSLGFITSLLSHFSVNTNLTLVESVINITQQEFDARKNREKEGQTIDDTRQMTGQAPYMVNTGFQYDNPGIGFDAGFYYNIEGETLVAVGGGLFPDVYSEPYHNLRLNLNKSLGKNNQATVSLSVSNILNEKRAEYYQGYNTENQVFSLYHPQRSISIGFTYNFTGI